MTALPLTESAFKRLVLSLRRNIQQIALRAVLSATPPQDVHTLKAISDLLDATREDW